VVPLKVKQDNAINLMSGRGNAAIWHFAPYNNCITHGTSISCKQIPRIQL
jgi:hypothetical protein